MNEITKNFGDSILLTVFQSHPQTGQLFMYDSHSTLPESLDPTAATI